MAAVAISSFWVHEIRLVGPWSPIHLLSIFVLIMLPLAVWRAHRHRVPEHRRTMISIFAGALVVAGLFTLLPAGSRTQWCSDLRATSTALVWGPGIARKTPVSDGLQEAGFGARPGCVVLGVSDWKNERKKRLLGPVKGGLQAPDGLYDSRV